VLTIFKQSMDVWNQEKGTCEYVHVAACSIR
jgi:hypothetical protein